ncbi:MULTISPECIES: sodium:solute symporter family transporter [Streptomyces]|uniref:sodium:solute symporter family transporter n=1 Tax=Streptomyces TaxID=1883 RepID=UPI00343833B2
MTGCMLAVIVPMTNDTRTILLMVFLGFLVGALLFCLFLGPEQDHADVFYRGRGQSTLFSAVLAMVGVCLPASTLLGMTGTISLFGYDGMFIALSVLFALALLLILARPLRRRGRFTIGDVCAQHTQGRAPRVAAGIVTLAVCLPLLMFELASAGINTALLLGFAGSGARSVFTIMIGVLIVSATVFGGMRGATALQIVKGVVLFAACAAVVILVMKHFGFNPGALLQSARSHSYRPEAFLSQGMSTVPRASDAVGAADFVGLQVTIILGLAGMPHVVMRINALSDDATAASVVCRVMYVVAAFMAGTVVMGLGAAALVGSERIISADTGGAGALMLLSASLAGGPSSAGGAAVFILVACALFVTVLAATASVTLAAAAAVAHDISPHTYGKRQSEGSEVAAAQWAAAIVGTAAIALAVAARNENIQQLTAIALSIAASSLLPALVYSLFWREYTHRGLLWTLYGGMGATLALLLFSPRVSGVPSSLFPSWHLDWFPLENVALVSAPVGFLLGYLATVLGRPGRGRRSSRRMMTEPVDGVGQDHLRRTT